MTEKDLTNITEIMQNTMAEAAKQDQDFKPDTHARLEVPRNMPLDLNTAMYKTFLNIPHSPKSNWMGVPLNYVGPSPHLYLNIPTRKEKTLLYTDHEFTK